MKLEFYKYQGAGNDFVMLYDPKAALTLSTDQVRHLCDRRYGIGADGLIVLRPSTIAHFQMQYYNSDGSKNTFCGNGGRCIALFAHDLGLVPDIMDFEASDGVHRAEILSAATHTDTAQVSLMMQDVKRIERMGEATILHTGSPHYIAWVEDLAAVPVAQAGSDIRHWEVFESEGINVNFVQRTPAGLAIRTYERGVEAETLACGTGITAAAIASTAGQLGDFDVSVQATGGSLCVSFSKDTAATATNILLKGPACQVFAGKINI